MGRLIEPFMTYLDANGAPLAGGFLQFNESGSPSTAKATYSDAGLTTANDNPIVLDSAGRAAVSVFGSGTYRMIVKNSAGTVQGTYDNLQPLNTASDTVFVEDYGATASDSDDDAAANAVAIQAALDSGAGTVILNVGTYRVNDTLTPAIHQRVIGQGKSITSVEMIDSVTGKPVWGIETHHIELAHFSTGWVSTTQTTADSVGIRFMDTGSGTAAACGWGSFHDMEILNTYNGIDTARSGTISGSFSWEFRNLYIREFENSAMYMHNLNNGSSGDTYTNVYIANARAGTQETGTMLDIREAANTTFNLVNLEANRMDATKPLLYLQNVTGFCINSLHIEDVDMDNHTGSDNGIIELSDKCIGVFNGIRVDGVTIPASADRLALFKIKTTNSAAAYQPRITVEGVSIVDTTGIVPATAWNLIQTNGNLSQANGARIAVRNIHTEKAFDGLVYNGDAGFLWDYVADTGNVLRLEDRVFVPDTSATPSNNGELSIEATSNTSLTFKYKGSDGTVRSGSITLS